jgi:CO/xanthine dehydrogenase FAD-binding subunit
VAVRVLEEGGVVTSADLVLNGVGSAPIVCRPAADALLGKPLSDETIAAAADLAHRPAKPLDNTDGAASWRKRMVKVEVTRALASLR